MVRALIARGGNPQGGADFILNQSEPHLLLESDEACLYRTDDTGHANVPLRLEEDIDHPIAMLKGKYLIGAESIPETGFTSLRALNTSGERDLVLDKLSPDDAALAEAYFGQADDAKDAHWSQGIDQGGDEFDKEFEDQTTSIHMFGGRGAKAPKPSERESRPRKVGQHVLKERWDASLSDLYSITSSKSRASRRRHSRGRMR